MGQMSETFHLACKRERMKPSRTADTDSPSENTHLLNRRFFGQRLRQTDQGSEPNECKFELAQSWQQQIAQ